MNIKEERLIDPDKAVRSWFHTHYPLEDQNQFGWLDVARFNWEPDNQ